MPRYKLLLIIIILILLLFFLAIHSASRSDLINRLFIDQEQNEILPGWLTRAHRLSGPYAFEFEPLKFDELVKPGEGDRSESTAPPSGDAYVNPGGSPYPPGTLADMIWQQKKQDQRYAD